MTTECPHCGETITVVVTHQGTSSDGLFQRALIEATHEKDAAGHACPAWVATQHDLVTLAGTAT